jgi:hypothetical protein
MYVPDMVVHHHIPSARLTPTYFRRWWFGKGVSKAALERMQPVTELGLDLRGVPHLGGVPRFMYGSLVRDVVGLGRETLRRRPAAAFRHQAMLAYFAGYFWARWRERREPEQAPGAPAPAPVSPASPLTAPRTWSGPGGDPRA